MAYAGDLSPEQAWELVQSDPAAVLVDVRTRAEWSYVGVPDLTALAKDVALIEWTTFPEGSRNTGFLDEVGAVSADKSAPVIFLCRSGVRSVAAAEAATAAGYTAAYNILEGCEGPPDEQSHRGHTAGWKVRGLPWKQG